MKILFSHNFTIIFAKSFLSASFYDKNSSLYNKPSKDTYKTIKT
ncbi:hypothetical protein HPOKI673_04985 [Helicobacter pylori oki673]|nr:hypothetical protein HPOKI154_04995 [Helicobacter pylori oki154]AHN42716.1 hypothetical protein HPOKI673_04985 [Helicobacter pylori oki673]